MIKNIFRTLLFSLLLVTQIIFAAPSNSTSQFLTISDIHFNPFYTCDPDASSCEVVNKLRAAPASEWKQILTQYDTLSPVYHSDANFVLFESALDEAKKQAELNHAQYVLLLGDLLAHDYKTIYQQYSGDQTEEGIQSFVNKSMTFIMDEFNQHFPALDVYTVVGNNDTYADHYVSEPQFYVNMTPIWSAGIKDKNAKAQMEKTFADGGYYAVDILKQNIRLIVLNTTFFSQLTQSPLSDGEKELSWLQQELTQAATKNQQVFIALHIAPGVDVYKTVKGQEMIELWKPQLTKRFLEQVTANKQEINGIFAGHAHTDWFQLIPMSEVPITSTPAISPQFGNNPGFKIYSYNMNSQSLQDFVTYFYSLDGDKQWNKEYDFNEKYQPTCLGCPIVNGMKLIQKTGALADYFKFYFAVSTNSQPITKKNKWLPYYWCAIWNISEADYSHCVKGNKFN